MKPRAWLEFTHALADRRHATAEGPRYRRGAGVLGNKMLDVTEVYVEKNVASAQKFHVGGG